MASESTVLAQHSSGLVYPLQNGIWKIRNHQRSADDIPPEQNVFGYNFDQRNKGRHGGWDLEAAVGTAVYSIRGGKIEDVGLNDSESGWGPNHVMQSFTFNGKVYTVRYCHLSSVRITNGKSINKGLQIGSSGETGRGSVPHLHIEFKLDGAAVDPRMFFGTPPF
jgi:murein DD-endopeptidase MepM/ murein hydrolase activator NlpD